MKVAEISSERTEMMEPNDGILGNGLEKNASEKMRPLLNGHSGTVQPSAKIKNLQAVEDLSVVSPCPRQWTKNETECYYFSETEDTWNSSQSYCSSHGGRLAAVDSAQEMAFVKANKASAEYWINLRRVETTQPWKWSNGSLVGNWLQIGGEGFCAYLNEKAASSTYCENRRYFICITAVRHN
ncbi:early activation antigen CD69-like isoform X3 [Hemicordylus capensis]|uniref:early activation antigen CD69-like isoform X3 n=1 Tax=Hemicordylus capensis TaxID=884348 RepID=UPI00230269A2|nr:early activation antigen CD69-like isoform X3 [Hemicordylus capensis]